MLFTPGPVEVPEEVLKASSYLNSHRSDEFREIVRSSSDLMSKFADSEETVILTGSGTIAVESMVYSMTSKGEGVLGISCGEFGNRLVESLKRHGCNTAVIEKGTEEALEVGEITEALEKNRNISTVCLVHNETGNGTSIRNLGQLTREAKDMGMKVLVDSVSGFGGAEIRANSWGIDALASCSQKSIAAMPGLGMVSIGKEGLEHIRTDADVPKYMDLSVSLKFLEKDETAYTPSTGSFNALLAALKILEKEGIENRWKRHSAAASFVRDNIVSEGGKIYGNATNFSDTVIAFDPPMDVNNLRSSLKAEGVLVSKGMKSFADKMIRAGFMGVMEAGKISYFLNSYFKAIGSEKRVGVDDIPEEAGFDRNILQEVSEELS